MYKAAAAAYGSKKSVPERSVPGLLQKTRKKMESRQLLLMFNLTRS